MRTRGMQACGRISKEDTLTGARASRGHEPKKSRATGKALAMQTNAKADGDGSSTQSPAYCPVVAFTLSAPEAKHVYVAGTFNNWDAHCTPLSKGINGEWSSYLPLKPGQYEYRFVIDGVWNEDPAARASVPNPFGSNNSVVIVREEHAL